MSNVCGLLGGGGQPPGTGTVGGQGVQDVDLYNAGIYCTAFGAWNQQGNSNIANNVVGNAPPMSSADPGAGGSFSKTDQSGTYLAYSTATTLNSGAGVSQTSITQNVSSWGCLSVLPEIIWVMKTGPDAADLQNIRFWAYVTSDHATAKLNADAAIPNALAFRYSTAAGDANWQSFTSDNAGTPNTTVKDTGVVLAAATRYILGIKVFSITDVRFYIARDQDRIVASDIKTVHASGTNLPNSTTQWAVGMFWYNLSAGTKRTHWWHITTMRYFR